MLIWIWLNEMWILRSKDLPPFNTQPNYISSSDMPIGYLDHVFFSLAFGKDKILKHLINSSYVQAMIWVKKYNETNGLLTFEILIHLNNSTFRGSSGVSQVRCTHVMKDMVLLILTFSVTLILIVIW